MDGLGLSGAKPKCPADRCPKRLDFCASERNCLIRNGMKTLCITFDSSVVVRDYPHLTSDFCYLNHLRATLECCLGLDSCGCIPGSSVCFPSLGCSTTSSEASRAAATACPISFGEAPGGKTWYGSLDCQARLWFDRLDVRHICLAAKVHERTS